MINYSLNYYEDFIKECQFKRIICVGVDDTFDKNIINRVLEFVDRVDYWITYKNDDFIIEICNKRYPVKNFDVLNKIDLDKYVLLIVSHYVDYIKKILEESLSDLNSSIINCYTYKLIKRDYNDRAVLNRRRWEEVSLYWYEYYLRCLNKNVVKEKIDERAKKLKKKDIKVIPRLVVVLTTKCNLNCENCIALTPYYKHQYDIPLQRITDSIDIITNAVDECTCLELIGGEPFLYSELVELLQYLKLNKKIKLIQITTNGMVFNYNPKYEELLQNNVTVRISNYNLSDKTEKFINWLNDNHIGHVIQNDLMWVPVGNIEDKHKTLKRIKDEYNLCFEGLNCKTLLNGKIFDCTFSSRIKDLGFTDFCENIDVLSEEITWQKLYNFFIRNESKACNYCNMMNPNVQLVECAIQKIHK